MKLISLTSLLVQFYFISFHLWLCQSLNVCDNADNVEFVRIEPEQFVSHNEPITIHYQSTNNQISTLNATFVNSVGGILLCLDSQWKVIDVISSTVTCKTSATVNGTFQYNTALNLETLITCANQKTEIYLAENVTTLIDPEILDYSSLVFIGYPSKIEIHYGFRHPKHINQTGLSFETTVCDKIGFQPNSDHFECLIYPSDQLTHARSINLVVSLSNRPYIELPSTLTPAPVIQATSGSTFAGALNPIYIFSSSFELFVSNQLFLKTNYSSMPNNCTYLNETTITCQAALGLKPVSLVSQVNFTLLIDRIAEIPSVITFTQNANPFIISADFSFSDQILTLIVYHYDTYYEPFTAIEIFDDARKATTPCANISLTSIATLTCTPLVKLSPDHPYGHHATLIINSWKVTHQCINCPAAASSSSKLFIVAGLLSAFLLSIVTSIFVCTQLEKANTLGVFKPPAKKNLTKLVKVLEDNPKSARKSLVEVPSKSRPSRSSSQSKYFSKIVYSY